MQPGKQARRLVWQTAHSATHVDVAVGRAEADGIVVRGAAVAEMEEDVLHTADVV
jgi:hypothetical protein